MEGEEHKPLLRFTDAELYKFIGIADWLAETETSTKASLIVRVERRSENGELAGVLMVMGIPS